MADLNTYLTRFLYSRLPSFSSSGSVSGVLTANTTQPATIADTNETDLWTYTLPANTLSADGRIVRITAFGSYGATANNKTVKLYFGGSVVTGGNLAGLAANGVSWEFTCNVIRTGASAQVTHVRPFVTNLSDSVVASSASVDTTAAIVIKVTGQNGTAAANDIVFKGAIVEILN